MPSRQCAVLNCRSSTYSGKPKKSDQPALSWHRFPKDETLQNEWIKSCRRSGFGVGTSRVCSTHFSPDDFERDFKHELLGSRRKRMLKPEAVPSLNLELPLIEKEDRRKSARKRKGSEVDLQGEFSCQGGSSAKRKQRRKELILEITDDESDGDQVDASGKGDTVEFVYSPPAGILHGGGSNLKTVSAPLGNANPNDGLQNAADTSAPNEGGRANDFDGTFEDSETLHSKGEANKPHGDLLMPHCPSSRPADGGSPTLNADPGEESSSVGTTDSTSEISRFAAPASAVANTTKDPDWCKADCHYRQMFLRVVTDRARLELKCKTLESEAAELSFQMQTTESVEKDIRHAAAKVLTENQVALLANPNAEVKWKNDEIIEAIMLRYHSMKTFHYLRRVKGLPMPDLPVLRRWVEGAKLGSGIPPRILQTLKIKCDDLPASEKLCVLSINEFEVHKTLEFDERRDRIIGPHEKMQVMMASSLSGSWKQPVFIAMDRKLTKVLVLNVVNRLKQVGCTVVCCSTDCSESSISLWKELGVTSNSPIFHHPFTNQPIVLVPDAPHLLRLLRDQLLNSGFEVDGSLVNKEPLDALLNLKYLDVLMCSKLKACHLVPGGNTILAAELMSNTVGSALIRHLPDKGELATCTGNFFKIVNYWFDLVNVSTSKNSPSPFKSPYGTKRDEQDQLLAYVKTMISNLKCCQTPSKQPFQSGIIMLCNALPVLIDIVSNHGVESIATRFLNQESLSELCDLLKRFSKKDPLGRPSPLNVLHRLKLILLGRYPESCLDYATVSVLRDTQILSNIKNDDSSKMGDCVVPNDPILEGLPPVTYDSRGLVSSDILKSIARELSFAYRHKYPHFIESRTPPSHGCRLLHETTGLTPTNLFVENIVKLETIFELSTVHESLEKSTRVVQNLVVNVQKSNTVDLPVEIIRRFFKVRVAMFVQQAVSKMDQMWLKDKINQRLISTLKRSST